MRILLQFPEGLKQKALDIARKYEAEGHEVFLSASACYGACDIALDEARWIKAGKIVHFGHNRFVAGALPIPVEYVEYRMDIDIAGLSAVLPRIKEYKDIGIATTVQHVHQLAEMKAFFEKNGKRVHSEKGTRASAAGQVLGCDAGAVSKVEKSVEAVVFIGDGMFHPLAIGIDKPVFVFNPYVKEVRDITKDIERLKKRRRGSITSALSCERFGILLSTKPGQFSVVQAQRARKELLKRGKECAILVANELEPMSLANFMSFECYINTGCPRMADDSEEFGRPVLSMDMFNEFLRLYDAVGKVGKD